MENESKQKIALYFGSFDPVHLGHEKVAQAGLNSHSEVWFVLTPSNPFKQNIQQSSFQIRLKLLEAALENTTHFKICILENSLPQPNYTYKTLKILRDKYPSVEFSILMGEDIISTFTLWKNYKEIIQNHSLWIHSRKTQNKTNSENFSNKINWIVNSDPINISSSCIRTKIINNEDSYSKYLNPKVYKKIKENKFYL